MSEEGTPRPLSIKERIAALNKTISDVSSMSPGPLSPSTSSSRGGAPRRTHQPSVLSSTGKFGENEATSASTAGGGDKALESSSQGLGKSAGGGVAALRAGLSTTLKPSTPHDNRIVGGIALPLPLPPTPLADNNDPSTSTPRDGATRVVSVGRSPGKGIQERLAQLQTSSSTSNQIGLVAGHPLLGTPSRSGPSQEIDMNLKSPSKEGEMSGSSSITGSVTTDPLETTPTPKKRGTSAIEQRLAALGGEAALMMASPNRLKPPPPGGVALPSLCATPHSIGGSSHHHHNNASSLSDSTSEAATRVGFSFLSPSNSNSIGRTTFPVASPSKGDEVGEGPRKLEHATMNRVTLQRPRRRTAGAASPKITASISAGMIESEDRKEEESSSEKGLEKREVEGDLQQKFECSNMM